MLNIIIQNNNKKKLMPHITLPHLSSAEGTYSHGEFNP